MEVIRIECIQCNIVHGNALNAEKCTGMWASGGNSDGIPNLSCALNSIILVIQSILDED